MRWWVLIVALLPLLGCGPLSKPEPGDRLMLRLEGDWSPSEVSEIQWALSTWLDASHGRVDVRITAGDDADATLTRGQVVGSFETFSRIDRQMRIDADALAQDGWTEREGIGALTGSMVGRMLGMRRHDSERGFLSRISVTPEITPNDVESCRNAGFC